MDKIKEWNDSTESTPEYEAFVNKFKPKRTTDDCYTPPEIYEVIKDHAVAKYGLQGRQIIRPFYPGGDYENAEYPEGCVVLDNPPFSILARVIDFYNEHNIDYYLFGPGLTIFQNFTRTNCIVVGASVEYDNKAKVSTSFCTNLGEYKVEVDGELRYKIDHMSDMLRAQQALPKYSIPTEVVNSARLQRIAAKGLHFALSESQCAFTRWMDAQKAIGKTLYGGGVYMSREKAEEARYLMDTAEPKPNPNPPKRYTFELTDREKAIIDNLK